MSTPPAILVAGATGVVGRELVAILAQRGVPHRRLVLASSPRSAGTTVPCGDRAEKVQAFEPDLFDDIDIAYFCAGSDFSRRWADEALARGVTVIDNASCFRMRDDVPLVVPEINADALRNAANRPAIIANPNCSTIIALMAVTPLHRAAGVTRMVVATYQALSGGGMAMMRQLADETDAWRRGDGFPPSERPFLHNVFSHDSPVGDDGYNEEETKLARETAKIWDDAAVRVAATCVRVPVLRTHCEAINLTLRARLSETEARDLLAATPGVRIVDDRAAGQFPEPAIASGEDDVLVGRIRADRSQDPGLGLELFVAGDQLRKGAALNAVQIGERLVQMKSATSASA